MKKSAWCPPGLHPEPCCRGTRWGKISISWQTVQYYDTRVALQKKKYILSFICLSHDSPFYLFHGRQVVAQKKLAQSHDRLSCNCNIVISCFSWQYRVIILSHGWQVVIRIKWPCLLTDCPETMVRLVWHNSTNQWPRLVTDNVLLLAVLSHDCRATYECYDLFVMMSMRAEVCCRAFVPGLILETVAKSAGTILKVIQDLWRSQLVTVFSALGRDK